MSIKVRRMDTKSSIYFTLSLIGIGVVCAFDEFIRQKGNENLFNFIICFIAVVLSFLIIKADSFILRKYSEYYDFFDYTQRYLNEISKDGTNLLTTCIFYIFGTALCFLVNNNVLHWIIFVVTMVFAVIPPLITWLLFLPKQVVKIVKLHYPIAQFISSLINVFIPVLLSLNILNTYILNKNLLKTQSTSLAVKLATVIIAMLILIIGAIIIYHNSRVSQRQFESDNWETFGEAEANNKQTEISEEEKDLEIINEQQSRLKNAFYRMVIFFHNHSNGVICLSIVAVLILVLVFVMFNYETPKEKYHFYLGDKYSIELETSQGLTHQNDDIKDMISQTTIGDYEYMDFYSDNDLLIAVTYMPENYLGIEKMKELYNCDTVFDAMKEYLKQYEDESTISELEYKSISCDLGTGEIYCYERSSTYCIECCIQNGNDVFSIGCYYIKDMYSDKEDIYEEAEDIIKSAKIIYS